MKNIKEVPVKRNILLQTNKNLNNIVLSER